MSSYDKLDDQRPGANREKGSGGMSPEKETQDKLKNLGKGPPAQNGVLVA